MSALSNSVVISERPLLSSGSSLKSADGLGSSKLAFNINGTRKSCRLSKALVVQASYSDGGRSSGGSGAFISGFVLGGLIVGTLGCVYAPQISKALIGTDKKDLMKKLPKFLYDEEKVLEKQRNKLAEKIEQLNSALDNVSTQLRTEESSTDDTLSVEDKGAVV